MRVLREFESHSFRQKRSIHAGFNVVELFYPQFGPGLKFRSWQARLFNTVRAFLLRARQGAFTYRKASACGCLLLLGR